MSGHEHRFTPDKAEKLVSEDRQRRLPAEKIMNMMELGEHDTVADLGAGNGFFTIPIAKATKRTVYAVDIEPEMLEMLKERAKAGQAENISTVTSDLENIPVDDHSLDRVLISFVLHEVPSIETTLDEIERILKSGGTVLFLDWKAVETEEGPPLHIRIPAEKLEGWMKDRGFETKVYELDDENYAVAAKSK